MITNQPAPRCLFQQSLINYFRLNTVCIHIFLCNRGGIKSFFFHNDNFLSYSAAVFNCLDNLINIGSLERITLSVIIPVLSKKFFKSPLVAVKSHDNYVFANTVSNISFVKSRNRALCHIVIFSIDYVERFTRIND